MIEAKRGRGRKSRGSKRGLKLTKIVTPERNDTADGVKTSRHPQKINSISSSHNFFKNSKVEKYKKLHNSADAANETVFSAVSQDSVHFVNS